MALTDFPTQRIDLLVNNTIQYYHYFTDNTIPQFQYSLALRQGDIVCMAINGKKTGGVFTAPRSGTYKISGGLSAAGSGLSASMIPDSIPLSDEEQKELEELEKANKNDIKLSKIAAFKALPAAIREAVVTAISMPGYLDALHQATVDKSDRHRELDRRSRTVTTSMLGGITFAHCGLDTHLGGTRINADYHPIKQYLNGEGVTDDEILKAHAEACIEDAMGDK